MMSSFATRKSIVSNESERKFLAFLPAIINGYHKRVVFYSVSRKLDLVNEENESNS